MSKQRSGIDARSIVQRSDHHGRDNTLELGTEQIVLICVVRIKRCASHPRSSCDVAHPDIPVGSTMQQMNQSRINAPACAHDARIVLGISPPPIDSLI